MKRNRLPRMRSALCVAAFLAVSMPTHALAQATSGGGPIRGVVTNQLPNTGNPDADTSNPTIPFIVLGAGVLLAGLAVGKRAQRQREVRRRQ
jgi:hypothetical protein